MRRHFAVLLTFLGLLVAGPAVTAASAMPADRIEPGPIGRLCLIALDPEPPSAGELPVIEDPVTGTSEGLTCSTRPVGPRTFGARDGEGQIKVADTRTDWNFVPDAQGKPTGQIRINGYASAVGDVTLSGVTITYTVSVLAPPGQPAVADQTVTIKVNQLQKNGSLGGTNITVFTPDIPKGSLVFVELTSGSGTATIDGVNKGFTISKAHQGLKTFP